MKTWAWYMWTTLFVIIGGFFLVFSYLFYIYYSIGVAKLYVTLAAALVGYYGGSIYFYSNTFDFHLHHYFLAMIAMAFTGY
jgi:hypothetical protein